MITKKLLLKIGIYLPEQNLTINIKSYQGLLNILTVSIEQIIRQF